MSRPDLNGEIESLKESAVFRSKQLAECEAIIEKGKATFVEVGIALQTIRDCRLYFSSTCKSFEDYCQSRWGWSRQRSSQLIQAAEIVTSLPKTLAKEIPNEWTARALSKVPPSGQKSAIKEIKKNGNPISALNIERNLSTKVDTTATSVDRRDKTGFVIPPKIYDLWDRAESESKVGLDLLSRARSAIRNAQKEDDSIFREMNFSAMISYLDNAYSEMKRVVPHAVCTNCQGQTPTRCTLCKGRGFISQFAFDTFVPSDLKAIRERGIKK